VALKGSGTVIAESGKVSVVNLTGNARLATAGTGDVLAGMVGAALAARRPAFEAAREAVGRHGALADRWPIDEPLTAGMLARG
jgi:NAD(P)H-hydrate repair Nnr-like enzyme with NAD(P)H-hydrate dehydratase domain